MFAFLGLSIFSFPHKFEISFVIWCIVSIFLVFYLITYLQINNHTFWVHLRNCYLLRVNSYIDSLLFKVSFVKKSQTYDKGRKDGIK